MRSRHLILIVSLITAYFSSSAQDVGYSQYFANPVYLNPALAGSKICPRVTLNYRNQWPAISKGYISYSAAWDQHFDVISGGVAILANDDAMAGLNMLSGSVVYSYRLRMAHDLTLNAALQAGYFQYRLDWDKLIFEDQIISGEPTKETRPDNLSVGDVDFAAGLLLGYNERVYLGGAVHHITMPDVSFYSENNNKLDMKITIHAGALYDQKEGFKGGDIEDLSFSPNIVYIQQGNFHQLNTGMYVNFYPFVSGLWFRHNFENPDALILLLGFQQPQFKIGYSFDFTLSKLSLKSGGAHEVSFAWQLPCPKKEFKYKAIKCPSF